MVHNLNDMYPLQQIKLFINIYLGIRLNIRYNIRRQTDTNMTPVLFNISCEIQLMTRYITYKFTDLNSPCNGYNLTSLQ